MKCSPRSTTWFAEVALLACGLALVPATARPSEDPAPPAITAAIATAVADRVGEGFTVDIVEASARLVEPVGDLDVVEAVPAPGSRLGTPMRFTIVSGEGRLGARTRLGDAVATVRVFGPVPRAAHAMARGAEVAFEDLDLSASDAGDVRLGPLPTAEDVLGAVTIRDVVAGEVLTAAHVRVPPLVESGQLVTTVVRIGNVQVEGRAIASQRGVLGQTIRLVNPDSRQTLRGTVVAAGRVEVLNEP